MQSAPSDGGSLSGGAAPASGDDTSVASPGADAGVPGAEESQPPSAGEGEGAAPPASAIEDVDGYQPPAAESGAEVAEQVDDTLRDVGEASFGPPAVPLPGPGAEVVLGADDRVQITNTTAYPWRANASLRITANDGSQWIGTGWFVGPHTLVTAGHCVFIRNSGVPNRDGWVRSITVIPGRNGSAQPYGAVVSTNFRSVTGWTQNGNQEYDYGAIILSSDLGSSTGWFGFGAFSDDTLRASTANISGYPGDKPAGTQWYHARRVTSVGPRKVFYDVDTAGGQSGSAVYRISNGQRHAIAVHAYGGSTANSGTRITSAAYSNIVAWKA